MHRERLMGRQCPPEFRDITVGRSVGAGPWMGIRILMWAISSRLIDRAKIILEL